MKKVLVLLALTALPLVSGCCCTNPSLCPLCPCNWFRCGTTCAPAPTYAAPLAASPCGPATYVPSPCMPASTATPISPLSATVMPQYVAPPMTPVMTQSPAMCCPPEPNCAYAVEPNCGGPYFGTVSYGPAMDCGCNPCGCDPCSGGCSNCSGSAPAAAPTAPPAPEQFRPAPGSET
ncbi:MAG: hypothetical protein IT425_10825 [Pirellulales bacterium]|nr:hypothetical protein [Pirellulales bacterium]